MPLAPPPADTASFGFLAEQGLDRLGGALARRVATPQALCGRRLLAPGGLELALEGLCRQQPEAPLRGLLSLWSRYYFYRLIPPLVLTLLQGHRQWPLHLRDSGVVLDETGLPATIALPDSGPACAAPADPFARFAPLVQDHLAPLIAHLAATARLAPRVLWANAAGYFAWAVRQVAEDPTLAPGTAAPGLVLVHSATLPDGTANPLFEPMRPQGGQSYRKVCCLLYLLPDRRECPYCPLLLRKGRCGDPAAG